MNIPGSPSPLRARGTAGMRAGPGASRPRPGLLVSHLRPGQLP